MTFISSTPASSYRLYVYPWPVYQKNPIDNSKIREQAILFDEAIFKNDIETVKKMIAENGALVNYELQIKASSTTGSEFRLPLQTSLQYASDELTEMLLKAGAKSTTDDVLLWAPPPFTKAFFKKNVSIVQLMLKGGANPNYEFRNPMVDTIRTPLEIALQEKFPFKIVHDLLGYGAIPTDRSLKSIGIVTDPSTLSSAEKIDLIRKRCMELSHKL